MSDTENMSGRRGPAQHIVTPHVGHGWREAFVIEQRLADVPGDGIGDALATVDAHCAESGESAAEAFGDPVAYARSLQPGPQHGSGISARTALGLVLGLAALFLVPRAVDAWVAGTGVGVSAGDLVALSLCFVLVGVVLARPVPVLGWIMRHQGTAFVLPFVVLIAMIVPQALWRDVLAEPAWSAVLGVGVLLLVLNVILTWPDLTTADPIRDPRLPPARRGPRGWPLVALMFPFLTLLVLGMDAVVRAFA